MKLIGRDNEEVESESYQMKTVARYEVRYHEMLPNSFEIWDVTGSDEYIVNRYVSEQPTQKLHSDKMLRTLNFLKQFNAWMR
jgi:hypothetical protein